MLFFALLSNSLIVDVDAVLGGFLSRFDIFCVIFGKLYALLEDCSFLFGRLAVPCRTFTMFL